MAEKLQCPEEDGHPLTGSSDHYVLYDKFHEANTRDPQEVLRRINLVPELQGSLNSQVAEQLFSTMQKNNYYLNNMAPSTHIFFMRNLIHHRNNNTNARLMEQQLKRGLEFHNLQDITLNEFGQAVLGNYQVRKMYLVICQFFCLILSFQCLRTTTLWKVCRASTPTSL